MNSLFGVELPTSVTFIIAFVVVLALIGAAAWLVRRFGAGRLAAGRGRQPRLAVIDAASVDGRRKLIIIRRDNVEHLLMIGGPTDVVVETNIVRASATNQRETPAARGAEPPPRAQAVPESPAWPQPEIAPPPRPERQRPVAEEPAPIAGPLTAITPSASSPPPPPPPPLSPPQRTAHEPSRLTAGTDPLLGLAAELSRTKIEATLRPADAQRPSLTAGQGNGETPAASAPLTPGPLPAARPVASPIPPVAQSPATAGAPPLSPEAHLAEMAQRLENALKRPLSAPAARRETSDPPADGTRSESKTLQFADLKPAPASHGVAHNKSANGAPTRSSFEDLEQEMASLLGRQTGKS